MPKVSVNILTKDRAELLTKALASVENQSFKDYEIVVVNDGSRDTTSQVLKDLKITNLKIIDCQNSLGISEGRMGALNASAGEYVAILDDDDQWADADKLAKQVKFLDEHRQVVLCGGGIRLSSGLYFQSFKYRPETDEAIRRTMLFRNNFFTSTVMFRKQVAIRAGGFVNNGVDLAEDYDLWLRMGKFGAFYNFPEVFTLYRQPTYNKERFKQFLAKQLRLIRGHKTCYPWYYLAAAILYLRLKFLISNF